MKRKMIYYILLFLLINVVNAEAQQKSNSDTTTVNTLLQKSKELSSTAPDEAIEICLKAKELAENISFTNGVAQSYKRLGIIYYLKGKYLESISYYTKSLEVFKSINDQAGVANLLSNMGVIHSIQGDYEKALEVYLKALKAAELAGDKGRMASTMVNIGANYALKKETYDKALKYYLDAIVLLEEVKDTSSLGTTYVNIGEIYSNKEDHNHALKYLKKSVATFKSINDKVNIPSAYNTIGKEYKRIGNYALSLEYHNIAYSTALKSENKLLVLQSLKGLGNTYSSMGEIATGIRYLKRAEELGNEINALDELKDLFYGLSISYSSIKRYDDAFHYQTLYSDVKDSLYNIATDKKLANMQFDFELEKKENEISFLTKDKELQENELKRQRFAKNAFMVGIILIFIITYIIFRNYRNKVKVNKVLDQQKNEIEQLLLNILPAEVAKELQVTGHATPMNYDHASVLFTDFKGFTLIADKLSPEQLVNELNHCFEAFDDIIERNGLEKIKTIGDAYMCAGGIPVPNQQHPFKMVKAALEIQDYIVNYNQIRKEQGLETWEIRIGIHVGPLTAGVVGKKKYAYDIWGSTVNIASRMESSGVPGQVNISADTYEIIKDKYNCVYRGKIYAKNVGEIDMYLVDAEKGEPGKIFTDVEPRIEEKIKTDQFQNTESTLLQ